MAVCVLAGALSCSSQPADSPTKPKAAPAPRAGHTSRPRIVPAKLARALHDGINQERRRQGLPTFRWDAALGRIAGRHSRDMAKRNYFSHLSPEGRGPSQRYLKEHYACGITIDGVLRNGAEVIYRDVPGPTDGTFTKAAELTGNIAGRAIDEWSQSDDDRKNILSPHWQREGIGVFMSPDGTVYITVNFC
jgi:uncharacterized protein YkwD